MIRTTRFLDSVRSLGSFVFALLVVLGAGAGASAKAEVIQFPDDELANESVLPVFDHPEAVKNRSVLTGKRFEVSVMSGLSLLEPFYNPLSVGATVSYNFNEMHAINLTGLYFMQGLSSNAQNLNPIAGTKSDETPNGISANLQYAPSPKYAGLAEYQYTGFYGKISVAKEFVMNLSIYGIGGLGTIQVGDAMHILADAGIGQKLYFTPNFALRVDFRVMAFNGPDLLSLSLSNANDSVPSSQFGTKMNYSSLLSLGAVYLFPGM
jgi:outer membrane beta-barrel protein